MQSAMLTAGCISFGAIATTTSLSTYVEPYVLVMLKIGHAIGVLNRVIAWLAIGRDRTRFDLDVYVSYTNRVGR
jgi:hypothetical protein